MSYRVGCIYRVHNKVNGKEYYGQTLVKPSSRWSLHICAANHNAPFALPRAIRKYGVDNFTFEVVHRCTAPLLNFAEREFIKQYDSLAPHGYNLTTGGDASGSVSESTRRKHSRQLKGRVFTDEHKQRLSAAQFARFAKAPPIWTDEAKAKLSATNKGKKPSAACMEASRINHVQGRTKDTLSDAERTRRSESAYSFWADRSDEERTASALKAVATRRRNAAMKKHVEALALAKKGLVH